MNDFVDYFNQPIIEKSRLIASINGRLKLCVVEKLNKKTIVVRELEFKNGTPIRVSPEDTIVISGEDLTVLVLRRGIQL